MGTITAEVVDSGEKRDMQGRRVTTATRRAELVRAFATSGMTMAAFAHGKDPSAYLRDVLKRLPDMTNQDDLGPLTPSRWQPS